MTHEIYNITTLEDLRAIHAGPFNEAGYAADYKEETPEAWVKTLGFNNTADVKQIIIAAKNGETGKIDAAVMAQVYPDGNVLVGFTPMTEQMKDNPALVKSVIPDMLKKLHTDLENSGQKIGGIFMERPRPDDPKGSLKREISEAAGFSWLKTKDGQELRHYEPVADEKEAKKIENEGFTNVKDPLSLSVSWIGKNGQTLPEAVISMQEEYIKKDGFHAADPKADHGLALTEAQADNLSPLTPVSGTASQPALKYAPSFQ